MKSQSRKIKLGARWDDPSQSSRFREAKHRGLLDYVEVTCPFASSVAPEELGLPMLAHSAENPLCSVYGLNPAVAQAVSESAFSWNSPWVGEHLAFLSTSNVGALGYVINPLLTDDFKDIAVANTRALQKIYDRPVALELGPIYSRNGTYESELHFLQQVATESDASIVFDVSHWQVSNHNLSRDRLYGLEALDPARVIELHIAGIRSSSDGRFWHDAHGHTPSDELLETLRIVLNHYPSVRAVTFEHAIEGKESDFYSSLERIKKALI